MTQQIATQHHHRKGAVKCASAFQVNFFFLNLTGNVLDRGFIQILEGSKVSMVSQK